MKAKNQFTMKRFSIFLTAMTIVIMSVVMFAALPSCQNSKTDSEIAPPPPPPPVPGNEILTEVDEMPVFTGGDQALLQYIAKNTRYPEEAKSKGITGRVIVGFVVEKDGTVSQTKIIKGVDPALDAEALRVVGTLPAFGTPGKKGGVAVRVQYMVPLTFALK